jgi:hypothetical protein
LAAGESTHFRRLIENLTGEMKKLINISFNSKVLWQDRLTEKHQGHNLF